MTTGFGNWPPTPTGGGQLIGFATIEGDGTISRTGGIVTSIEAHVPGSGEYNLFVVPAAAGDEEEDPQVAAVVQPDPNVIPGVIWAEGAWEISLVNNAGAAIDGRFSINFYK